MSLHPFYPIFDDVAWLRRMLPLGVKLAQPQTILQAEIKRPCLGCHAACGPRESGGNK